MRPSIVSIGAGKVATSLIYELHKKGYPILSVYSRTLHSAHKLANHFPKAAFTDNLLRVPDKADVYIISLTDDAIPIAVNALSGTRSIVVHTSGSAGIEVFSQEIIHCGILYPLQTFNKINRPDFLSVPLLLEASDSKTMKIIREIGADLSGTLIETNSEERKWIHIAAVFACNFLNYMLTCSNEVLKDRDLKFKILVPLIMESVKNAIEHSPSDVQSGPAIRGDEKIIQEHISLLKGKPDLQKIYTFVSRMISEYYHK